MRLAATAAVVLATTGSTMARPTVAKRAITDADILNYALTLEHLEDKFYREGLANFTQQQFADAGYDATFYKNLKEVSYDETTHVSFLTGALTAAGAKPVAECTYAFGVTSVAAFVATASILEGVGVSAYLRAAASIVNKEYLTAAGSILTVESRHSSYLRASFKESPFPQPFDTPLDFDEVYTLAAPFIVSCPSTNAALPVKAFPGLALTASSAPVTSGKTIQFTAKATIEPDAGKDYVYAAWVAVTGPIFTKAYFKTGGIIETTVPAGFHGQSYVVITGCNSSVSDDTVKAGPAIVEVTNSSGSP
ncbi:uncharacterized protein BDZ99DRAFT_434565 [Mytilinidion resinicola]|uniref:Ferritin-like domain-containing protein n=1 Tax=Mytilinidion resinicola TaxID=574789 RepID=A0A6A6Z0R9_9PEZI|nr:uncharacterized protein BDZ99DRAFT_434565 [Mytilinidion resinicola]KAF2814756.1 hypothetical protein BDZ99DRAFT_434565 [Mytilinidion resinicola]